MLKPNRGVLKQEGRAARSRALDRQGSGKISPIAWYPDVEEFRERGWRIAWIADALDVSERHVRRILKEGREARRKTAEMPVHVPITKNLTECLQFTADGFEVFFNQFSGKQLPAHTKQWIDLFIAHPNAVINTPPRHAKTTILAIWLPVWLLCIDRNEQILLVSKTQRLAQTTARSIATILESDKIVQAFGRFGPETYGQDGQKWAPISGELMVAGRTKTGKPGDLSVGSFGMDQQILGFEATVVIADDITDAKVAAVERMKAEEVRKFRDEVLSRLESEGTTNAAGRVLVVGQRVHADDIYGDLIDGTWDEVEDEEADREFDWYPSVQPCVLDWENEVTLWPEVRPMRWVRLTKKRVGSLTFETMYQQNPLRSGDKAIRPEWIEACKDKSRIIGEGARKPGAFIPVARVVSIDPSPSEWNAMLIADVANIKGNWACLLVDCERWKGGTKEFQSKVEGILRLYKPDYLIVENSTFFRWIMGDTWFENLRGKIRVIDHHTGVNKNDLELGADSLGADFEAGRINIPWGNEESQTKFQQLVNEALDWPGKLYDVFMSLWFIKWNRKSLRPRIEVSLLPVQRSKLNASGRLMYDAMLARAGTRAAIA